MRDVFRHGADPRAADQLALIEEVGRLAGAADVAVWLRGGWALDLFLGHITRPHGDIDFFVLAEDSGTLRLVLSEHNFEPLPGPPPEQQLNFRKLGEELHFGLVRREASGAVVVAGGPYEGAPWPEGMLGDHVGRLADLTARIVSPESMLEVKTRWQEWTGRPPRSYDAQDIELLQAALTKRGGGGGI
jgi:Aminoglycoside-2''-adenylyltransferase